MKTIKYKMFDFLLGKSIVFKKRISKMFDFLLGKSLVFKKRISKIMEILMK